VFLIDFESFAELNPHQFGRSHFVFAIKRIQGTIVVSQKIDKLQKRNHRNTSKQSHESPNRSKVLGDSKMLNFDHWIEKTVNEISEDSNASSRKYLMLLFGMHDQS
jgi:hypothetical protein